MINDEYGNSATPVSTGFILHLLCPLSKQTNMLIKYVSQSLNIIQFYCFITHKGTYTIKRETFTNETNVSMNFD